MSQHHKIGSFSIHHSSWIAAIVLYTSIHKLPIDGDVGTVFGAKNFPQKLSVFSFLGLYSTSPGEVWCFFPSGNDMDGESRGVEYHAMDSDTEDAFYTEPPRAARCHVMSYMVYMCQEGILPPDCGGGIHVYIHS